MDMCPKPEVLDAQRMDGGVMVTFADGTSAIYSAALLYAVLDQAETIEDVEEAKLRERH